MEKISSANDDSRRDNPLVCVVVSRLLQLGDLQCEITVPFLAMMRWRVIRAILTSMPLVRSLITTGNFSEYFPPFPTQKK